MCRRRPSDAHIAGKRAIGSFKNGLDGADQYIETRLLVGVDRIEEYVITGYVPPGFDPGSEPAETMPVYPPAEPAATMPTYPPAATPGYYPAGPAPTYPASYPPPGAPGYFPAESAPGYPASYPPPGAPGYPPGYPPAYPTYPAAQPGYPTPYGSPYGAPPMAGPGGRPRMDRLSVASFILGLISFLILSIPFSIAGLVRTGQGRRRGRGFAIAGLALSVVWVIVIVSVIAFAAGRQPDRSADGTVTHQGSTSPVNLRVGDCVKLPPITAGEAKEADLVTVVPCSTPHNAQVFTIIQSTDLTYPGQSALTQEGLHACAVQAVSFIGTSSSNLEVVDFVPSSQLWSGGDRSERCLLVDGAEDITGDIRPHA